MKTCTKCKGVLEISEFYSHKQASDGLSPSCKKCEKIKKSKYYLDNLNKLKTSNKNWKSINKNKVNLKRRELRKLSTKDKEYVKLYKRKSRLNTNKRLADYLRNRLYSATKNEYKTGSAVSDLGCSIEEFRVYLESKWQPGMSWDNYGKFGWHIDHIKPLSSFDLSSIQGIKEACHYTNLQPLWWQDNLRKGTKRVWSTT